MRGKEIGSVSRFGICVFWGGGRRGGGSGSSISISSGFEAYEYLNRIHSV